MKKFLASLLILPLLMGACKTANQEYKMNSEELEIIRSGKAHQPFRVLHTTDEKDSIFLRQKSVDVDIDGIADNKDFQLFIERMKATLEVEEGVGLAAPQVGIGRNVFLFMRIAEEGYPVQVAINPRIVKTADEAFCFVGDGCLSIPGESGNTERYTWVEVEYYDEKGNKISERLMGGSRREDFTGVIFQHEFDHLNGILFTDRLVDFEVDEDDEDLD